MSTLLLRLAAPLQAWGVGAKFGRRDTQRMPTKSGITGMLAAALGRRRTDSIADLDALNMGVRVDQPGQMLADYHTVATVPTPTLGFRYYLADAVFLVGLEGEHSLLTALAQALEAPAFPLYLGRRACPPSGRVSLGLRHGATLVDALKQEPWQAGDWYRRKNPGLKSLQYMVDVPPGTPGSFFLRDQALSFDQARRRHGFRSLIIGSMALPGNAGAPPPALVEHTHHDAFANWGD